MLLTLCTISQLPQAFALAHSFCQHTTSSETVTTNVLIGLADDPNHLPAGFESPYPLLFLRDIVSASQVAAHSAHYTPVEFRAAVKPLFIAEAMARFPLTDQFLYADPNVVFLADTTPIWSALSLASVLLTPHVSHSPATGAVPDKAGASTLRPAERHLQNVGLYSSDFMGFRRSDETRRMLAWWQDRVVSRASINFCEGLCLDQLWLMHVPIFFRDVVVVRNPGWHVALWNLYERPLRQTETGWLVDSLARQPSASHPLLFANVNGLHHPDEGLFTRLNQPALSQRPDVRALLNQYRTLLTAQPLRGALLPAPAYGLQPQPVVLRGWRHQAVQSLRAAMDFVERVALPSTR